MKKASPFRTGALVPSLLLIAVVWAYFYFFFDRHLRLGLEYGLTQANGAEVNVGGVRTSFRGASLAIRDVEVTDKSRPERNLVKIGALRFAMLWDALLRGKIAIEEAAVLDIQPYVARRKPGYVLPPPPPSGLLGKLERQVLEQTRRRYDGNFLADLAEVAGGVDPRDQLKSIQGELKSQARALELEQALAAKKAEWEKRVRDLPKPQDIQAIEAKIKALNLNTKNPVELAQNLKRAKEILGEAQAKVKQVDQAQAQLTEDVQKYSAAAADLEKLARQDVADLQRRLKIPGVDPKEFATQLFMAQIERRLLGVRRYVELARKYMPPVKSPAQRKAERLAARDERDLLTPRRGQGHTYQFPITKGYPLFWLKKAAISSEFSQSDWAGKVAGELLDVTSSPSELKRPTKLHLAGDFPKQKIAGLDFLATLDHTTERARDGFTAKVASFPVAGYALADSPGVKLGVKRATGSAQFSGELAEEAVKLSIGSRFEKPEFEFDAKSPPVREILGSVLKGLPEVTMNAGVTGSWDKLDISIDSNLGKELSAGFQRQLQAKLGEAKAKLDSFVNERVGGNKKKVQELLGGLSSGPGKLIGQQKEALQKALASAEKSAQGGGGKAGGLLKGLGF